MLPGNRINLKDSKWSSLLPENLPPFLIEESLRPCDAFPSGVFPGSNINGKDKQKVKVQRFDNYIEFSKVTSDEVALVDGNFFLTTKFYERRKKGWGSQEKLIKEGEVVAYCINGDLYSTEDRAAVNKIFFDLVYISLVKSMKQFTELSNILKQAEHVEIFGVEEELLEEIKRVLILN